MEGRSGFKECPRCGLRNKRFALRCDFCGFEFRDSKEEWTDYLDILERLGKTEDADALDERVTKRIEATIVQAAKKPSSAPPRERIVLEDVSPEVTEKKRPILEEKEGIEADASEQLRELITSMVEEEPMPDETGPEAGEILTTSDLGVQGSEAKGPGPEEVPAVHAHHQAEELPSLEEELKVDEEAPEAPVVAETEAFEEPPRIEAEVVDPVPPETPVVAEAFEEPIAEFFETQDKEVDTEPLMESQDLTAVEAVMRGPEEAVARDFGLLSRASHVGFKVFLACFVAGIAVYLAIIASGLLMDISSAIGWTVALLATLLIVLGFGRLYETYVVRVSG